MKKLLFWLLSIILALAVFLACVPEAAPTPTPIPTPTPTPTPEKPYYEGETIEIVVSSAAGGGTDMVARITAQFIGKYIPGNPQITVSNQPGAAGQVAHKIFYEGTKPDGLTLLQSASSSVIVQRDQGASVAGYDVMKYKHIGNVIRSADILIIKKGERARLTDPSAKPIQAGCKAGDEVWIGMMLSGKEFLGWNLRIVPGYGGGSEIEMAFLRPGEVEMLASSNAFVINRLLAENLAEIICCQGKRADFPGVPSFEEILGDKKPTGLPWQAYQAVWGSRIDKYLSAPPGTPDNIVAILVEAYGKMSKDPEFDDMMRKQVSEAYAVYTGQEIADIINSILSVSPEALAYIEELKVKAGLIAK